MRFAGFMFHVASRLGVRITGTNTTTEQVVAVSRKIKRLGLDAPLTVLEADSCDRQGPFDMWSPSAC